MRDILLKAFPSVENKELSDDYIRAHPDPMWDVQPIPLIRAVPLYMLWCVEHRADEGQLVFDHTIGALTKYARVMDPRLE